MRKPTTGDHKDLYGGLIRLHILHHAAHEPLYGLWMIEELRHHGYKISPGTLYPMLHGLEAKGYLRSRARREGRQVRRLYTFVCMDWRHSEHVQRAARRANLCHLITAVWTKGNGGLGGLYRSAHEFVLVLRKGAGASIMRCHS